MTEIDCLASLAILASQSDTAMCRPKILDAEEGSSGRLEIRQMVHPCVQKSGFIPNDTVLNDKQQLLLVTGPNMGGKSTILR